MNLLPATLETTGDRVSMRVGTTSLPLSAAFGAAARDGGGRPVIVGIRPEDIDEYRGNHDAAAMISADVVTVEPLGAETLLTLRLPGIDSEIVARVGRTSMASVGERIDLKFDLHSIHLFDSETGNVLDAAGT